MYTHAHTHTYVHTHTYTHVHTHIHTHTHTHTLAHTICTHIELIWARQGLAQLNHTHVWHINPLLFNFHMHTNNILQ